MTNTELKKIRTDTSLVKEQFDRASSWFAANKLALNGSKTQSTIFSLKRTIISEHSEDLVQMPGFTLNSGLS